ncbi:YciI family protein [Erythrobacter sp.]|uniref:YciI family protein n=1 Tax=Erythrobacter sp. TaxID=1042 RepID=UPI0025D3F74D|nr:YciI family protein [Erythrobacter sp.]
MKLFVFQCRDGEHSAALRGEVLAAHLAYIETNIDYFAIAGPLKDGERTVGSLIVIKAKDAAEARARFEADPYFAAGVWEKVSVDEFLGLAGDWVGGAAWKN